MILTCNSCGKKFVVPDSAITSSGRMVQCGSCGNKWRQFPIGEIKKNQSITTSSKIISKPKKIKQTTLKPKKIKKASIKKPREISLYSPEYLAKKHGIKINEIVIIQDQEFKVIGKIKSVPDVSGFVAFGDWALASEKTLNILKLNGIGSFLNYEYKY